MAASKMNSDPQKLPNNELSILLILICNFPVFEYFEKNLTNLPIAATKRI